MVRGDCGSAERRRPVTEVERRQRVDDICDAALERAEADRAAFLDVACDGDERLRQEVEGLLLHGSHVDTFLNAPLGEIAASVLADDSVSLVGRRFGGYEVLSFIGAGGMGEVYRARDRKLNRDVALKMLPKVFSVDAERLARFRREARMLAS